MITPDPDKDVLPEEVAVDFAPVGEEDKPIDENQDSFRNQSLDAILAKPKLAEINMD